MLKTHEGFVKFEEEECSFYKHG